MKLRNYIYMSKSRKFQLFVGIIFLIIAFSWDAHAAKAAVAFDYTNPSVKEIDFNQFEVTFNSSSGFTPSQINNAIEVSGEKSNNIKIKNILKDGNAYTIYGSLNDYSVRYNKLFNPWLNASWGNRSVFNISNPKQFFPVNITTGYNKSDRWINCSDNTALPYWNETSNSKVWVNLTVNTSQICKYVNSTDFYLGNENGNATFAFFDDFGETGIDTTKWTVMQSAPGNVAIVNGMIKIIGNSNWLTNGMAENINLIKPYNVHFTEGVSVSGTSALSGVCESALCDPNIKGFFNYFANPPADYAILNTSLKGNLGYTAGINYSKRISVKNTGWKFFRNQSLFIDNVTDNVNFNRFQSEAFDNQLYLDNVFAYPYYDPEPKATLFENETFLNITSWGNTYYNNESLNISAQGINVPINFSVNTTDNPDSFSWTLNGGAVVGNFNYTNITFTSNGTYFVNLTVFASATRLYDNKNWTINYIQNVSAFFVVASNIVSNCGINIHTNLTNLAPQFAGEPFGTGERVANGSIYYTNDSSTQVWIFAHANSISQTASINLSVNGTMVLETSGRPLGGAEESFKQISTIIPRYSYYQVYIVNEHHYEWRESKIDLDISGCNYPSNNTSLNNVISGIATGLALLFSVIALAICFKRRKEQQ